MPASAARDGECMGWARSHKWDTIRPMGARMGSTTAHKAYVENTA